MSSSTVTAARGGEEPAAAMEEDAPPPLMWSHTAKCGNVARRTDDTAWFSAVPGVFSVQANRAWTAADRDRGVAYFEIAIDHVAPGRAVSLGLSSPSFVFDTNMQIGWGAHSISYIGSSGFKAWHNMGRAYGEPFTEGDVIGCGLTSDDELFFTHNGRFQGIAFATIPDDFRVPIVCAERAARVRVNFGAAPFRFDLSPLQGVVRVPLAWSKTAVGHRVHRDSDTRVRFPLMDRSVKAECGFPVTAPGRGDDVFYFEIALMAPQLRGLLAIGLCNEKFVVREVLAGEDDNAIGFHSDGHRFWGEGRKGMGEIFGRHWDCPDVVGCGLWRGHVFFTWRDEFLGVAYSGVPADLNIPVVSSTALATINANWGDDEERPFRFDVATARAAVEEWTRPKVGVAASPTHSAGVPSMLLAPFPHSRARRLTDLDVEFIAYAGNRSMRSHTPFDTARPDTIVYFEAEVVALNGGWNIAVGFCTAEMELERMEIGFNEQGYGFSSDARAYHRKRWEHYGDDYARGDVVGAGISPQGEVYFTLNGEFQGIAFDEHELPPGGVYAAVSSNNYAHLRLNFGALPFRFDPTTLAEARKPKAKEKHDWGNRYGWDAFYTEESTKAPQDRKVEYDRKTFGNASWIEPGRYADERFSPKEKELGWSGSPKSEEKRASFHRQLSGGVSTLRFGAKEAERKHGADHVARHIHWG